jgi:hypothetical protein
VPGERDLPDRPEQRAGVAVEHLLLGQHVHRPGREGGHQRTVEQADVVRGDDRGPDRRHVLGPCRWMS